MNDFELVKDIINTSITFRIIENGMYFPPIEVLNEYLGQGTDPADQDNVYPDWQPIKVDELTYQETKKWWLCKHPNAKEDWLELDISEADFWFSEAYDRI